MSKHNIIIDTEKALLTYYRNLMAFNEDSRVKISTLLHLTKLGYDSISRKEHLKRNEETNIFPGIFQDSIGRINPTLSTLEIKAP